MPTFFQNKLIKGLRGFIVLFLAEKSKQELRPALLALMFAELGSVAAHAGSLAPLQGALSEQPLRPARWHQRALMLSRTGDQPVPLTRFWLEVSPRDSPGYFRSFLLLSKSEMPPAQSLCASS